MGIYNDIRNGQYGDAVDKVTTVTGIKSAVKTLSDVMGVDCGCDKRREKWNKN